MKSKLQPKELRMQSIDALKKIFSEERASLAELYVKNKISPIKNTKKIASIKRNIARILTIMHELRAKNL